MNQSATSYEYKDKNFGDTEGITVTTRSEVFYPTSTTTLLLSAVRQHANPAAASVLDLGCGSGIVAVVLAKSVYPRAAIHASDIGAASVQLAQHNAAQHGLNIDCRCGSLFEPWAGVKFELIVDDVAGMSEPIARCSHWYPPQINSEAGEEGVHWIVQILEQAPDHLTPRGEIFFPVLTLSHEPSILAAAAKHFAEVELITEQWYPLGSDLLPHLEMIEDLHARGVIEIKKKGSRLLWATKIYRATKRNQ